jgi:transcriptional regulator with XRE-family HTH domain
MATQVKRPTARQYSAAKSDSLALFSLTKLRMIRGIEQRQIAKTIGVLPSCVSRYESASDPRISTFEAFVQATGGRLVLLAVYPEKDGSLTKIALKTADDPRRSTSLSDEIHNRICA